MLTNIVILFSLVLCLCGTYMYQDINDLKFLCFVFIIGMHIAWYMLK